MKTVFNFLMAFALMLCFIFIVSLAVKRCNAAMDCTEHCNPYVVKNISPCHCAKE